MNSLVRFSPTQEMRRMQHEIDRLFDTLLPTRNGDETNGEAAVWSPRVDLAETDDAYHIQVDLPGVDRSDVSVSYEDGLLTVSGERKVEQRDQGRSFVRLERAFGHFYRSFRLPSTVQDDKITASYKNGVLEIHVPKAEESKPRRIKVS